MILYIASVLPERFRQGQALQTGFKERSFVPESDVAADMDEKFSARQLRQSISPSIRTPPLPQPRSRFGPKHSCRSSISGCQFGFGFPSWLTLVQSTSWKLAWLEQIPTVLLQNPGFSFLYPASPTTRASGEKKNEFHRVIIR